jgi:predicted site-specific integrase-resolvase
MSEPEQIYTATEASKLSGVNRNTLKRWLRGERGPTVEGAFIDDFSGNWAIPESSIAGLIARKQNMKRGRPFTKGTGE